MAVFTMDAKLFIDTTSVSSVGDSIDGLLSLNEPEINELKHRKQKYNQLSQNKKALYYYQGSFVTERTRTAYRPPFGQELL